MPLILPGNVASATAAADVVTNSCRFNEADSAYMHKTPSGSPTSARIATVSFWFKLGNINNNLRFFSVHPSGDEAINWKILLRDANGRLELQQDDGSSGNDYELRTNMLFRDPSAWYHLVCAFDTTQGVAANRIKVYVNGTQITSWSSETYPDQNLDLLLGGTTRHDVGRDTGNALYYDGYMAEFVYIDGTQYAASDFGEFDEDSPTIWKPKDVSGLTFGNNGFYLDFEDSANLGNDANGGTDLTEVNLAAADQATDTPNNNFCVMNSAEKWYVQPTISEGNCKVVDASGGWAAAKGTMAVSTGKWYWEVQLTGNEASTLIGFQEINAKTHAINPYNEAGSTTYYNTDGGEISIIGTGTTTADYGVLDDGDILGIALDMDAGSYGQVTFYDQNSAIASNIDISPTSTTVAPLSSVYSATASHNFGGCSAFALTSAESDENGYGNFEFAPPSGYLALCTKNLATDG